MDAKFAEIYGTNQPSEADVEKLAAAELAEKLAGNEEADIAEMSDEQIESLAAQVLAQQSGQEAEEPAAEDEAQEKVAEADYLGRVMAHAYVNELRNIEKTAEEAAPAAEAPAAEAPKSRFQKVKEHLGKHKKKYIGGAVAAGTLAAGAKFGPKAVGAMKARFQKKSSALDALAEQRAMEILEANGIDINSLGAETKTSSSNEAEVLAGAVDQRAWEMLQELGFGQK
jgi:hypothetical protein